MEKNIIKLNESQLHNIIKESVKKVLKEMVGTDEISSDMISRASAKLYGKYGWNGTERDKLEKDEHGNPLHPKDKKPMAQHFKNFSDAFQRARRDELMADPLVAKAQELYDGGVDWDKEIDDRDGGGAFGSIYGEVLDETGKVWVFIGDASFEWEGGWEISEIDEVEFVAPNGKSGMIPRP